jgi:Iap family predicted aminopeptidase
MKMKIFLTIVTLLISSVSAFSLDLQIKNQIIGSAYTENQSYKLLQNICDNAGGRVAGSANNEKAKKIIISELSKIGINAVEEKFSMPCWERGQDKMTLIEPFNKEIRIAALGYVDKTPEFSGEIIYAASGYEDEYDKINAKGKIVIIETEVAKGREALLRMSAIDIAAKEGAKAVIFGNSKEGGLLLVSVANFHGIKCAIPALVITKEDCKMLLRQLEAKTKVVAKLAVNSFCTGNREVSNIIVTFPGENAKKIVLGAHFDSWDLSTGAIDNGSGSAVLFDIARLINSYSKNNYYTIELVWFNAEETGLWGSHDYADKHNSEVIAMVNMDMPGSPTGINLMGYDEFTDFSKNFLNSFPGFKFEKGVSSEPWINSDHSPMMMYGVPVFTFFGYLDKEMYWYYHDFADTFEKVNPRYLSDAAVIQGLFGLELANDKDFNFKRYTDKETAELLKKYKLDQKLKKQGEWKFGD